MTYRISALQMEEIAAYLKVLNSVENLGEELTEGEKEWGVGYHAQTAHSIPVLSDAKEPIGYLERTDFEWQFFPGEYK